MILRQKLTQVRERYVIISITVFLMCAQNSTVEGRLDTTCIVSAVPLLLIAIYYKLYQCKHLHIVQGPATIPFARTEVAQSEVNVTNSVQGCINGLNIPRMGGKSILS